MKYIQRIALMFILVASLMPAVSVGASTVTSSNQYAGVEAYGQGLRPGINQNGQTTGFFADAIYPLEGDFDAATYNGHSGAGALDFTKGYDTYGQPIYAVKDGTVTVAKEGCDTGYIGNSCNGGYGNHVEIDHGEGYQTLYAHMITGSMQVKVGDQVKKGDIIGYVGSTGNSSGPHLHFEVRNNEVSLDCQVNV